ncbi:hypothetical protein ACFWAP_34935 [Streptomyces goshikiensis]|uniref:hypothetical protein n=1 Tax=Streptomyces goshikiensis TaxID=1942 RepID=UPI003657BAD9
MSTTTPPKSPTVAIARALRGLGLTQGRGCDFRVAGEYRNGERVGTYVLALTRHADETIAAKADEIERLTGEGPFPFRVSVRYHGSRPMATVANYGDRVRETAPEGPPAAEPAPAPAPAPEPEGAPEETPAAPALVPAPVRPVHDTEPNACKWCGIPKHQHALQTLAPVATHVWEAPTDEQRKERMAARRAARTTEPDPEPVLPDPESAAGRYLEHARDRAWQRQRANALGWSKSQAHLIAMAGTAGLSYDREGILRDRPRPGWPGIRVDEARLTPLVKAGFIAVTQPYGTGYTRVATTQDGIDALLLWGIYRPTPVEKDRAQEREPLRPLLSGRYATSRAEAEAEDERRRKAEREALYAALEETHAWEERDTRLWNAWAKVQGITHRLGRSRPYGWAPTPEEAEEHGLDPATVAELLKEAGGQPTPKPKLPKTTPARPLDVPPLPPAPPLSEQLGLFAATA